MVIPGKAIALLLEEELRQQVQEHIKTNPPPLLKTILIGESTDQLLYVKSKQAVARRIGMEFDFINIPVVPTFEKFMNLLRKCTSDPKTTGIIVQQPLPMQLQTDSIYNYIHTTKEIEGHKAKSPFTPPISLATLTLLNYVYNHTAVDHGVLIHSIEEAIDLRKKLRGKKIVIVGRGITGGAPIGKTLNSMKINFVSVNAQTIQPEQYYKEADIIISAVGKHVINPTSLKQDVVLINVGLRKEASGWVGDYDDKEVESVASFYTPTPGGIGPLDVTFLFYNLLKAAQMQTQL